MKLWKKRENVAKKKRTLMGELTAVFLIYIAFVVAVYFGQRYLMYMPFGDIGKPQDIGLNGIEEILIETPDGLQLKSWYAKPKDYNGYTIIFFHGNAGNLSSRAVHISEYINHGYGFLLLGYRGYGGNPGNPSEIGLINDGLGAVNYLKENEGIKQNKIIYMGESLGTGVAVQVAAKEKSAALVLQAPFNSMLDIARITYWFFPVSLMLKDRYMSEEVIKDINAPLLIVHGEKDDIVPTNFGRKLFVVAKEPKTAVFIPEAGHNDLFHHGVNKIIINWLNKTLENKK